MLARWLGASRPCQDGVWSRRTRSWFQNGNIQISRKQGENGDHSFIHSWWWLNPLCLCSGVYLAILDDRAWTTTSGRLVGGLHSQSRHRSSRWLFSHSQPSLNISSDFSICFQVVDLMAYLQTWMECRAEFWGHAHEGWSWVGCGYVDPCIGLSEAPIG